MKHILSLRLGVTLNNLSDIVSFRPPAEIEAEERVLDALVGAQASQSTRDSFRQKLRTGELDDREIELEVADTGSMGLPTFDIPGAPGAQMGMINLNEMLGKAFGGRTRDRKMTVSESYTVLIEEESDKLLDEDKIVREAVRRMLPKNRLGHSMLKNLTVYPTAEHPHSAQQPVLVEEL